MAEETPARVKVRTTFRPDQEVEMDTAEAEDLRRQGLLVRVDQELEKAPESRQRPAARRGEQA